MVDHSRLLPTCLCDPWPQVFFGHLVAHRFAQHPTISGAGYQSEARGTGEAEARRAPDAPATQGTVQGAMQRTVQTRDAQTAQGGCSASPVGAELDGAEAMAAKEAEVAPSVPVDLTRTSEYPTLTAPWIHGKPHQSRREVLACLLVGTPPRRWAHVYTGNTIPCSSLLQPSLPPLPAKPATPLARVLVGLDTYEHAPHATAWLLRAAARSGAHDGALARSERREVRQHRRLMLTEMAASLRRRLRRLASGKEADLLRDAEADPTRAAYAQRSPLATPAVASAVAEAARAAMADRTLFPASRRHGKREGKRVAQEQGRAAVPANEAQEEGPASPSCSEQGSMLPGAIDGH